VQATGIFRPAPEYRPPYGAVWLDGNHLEERCWNHIRGLLDRTGTLTRSWMGLWWEYQGEAGEGNGPPEGRLFPWERGGMVRCELQRDDGYDGVCVRLDVPAELADLVRRTAVALGGGAGLA
jgi:hypothetical protein